MTKSRGTAYTPLLRTPPATCGILHLDLLLTATILDRSGHGSAPNLTAPATLFPMNNEPHHALTASHNMPANCQSSRRPTCPAVTGPWCGECGHEHGNATRVAVTMRHKE